MKTSIAWIVFDPIKNKYLNVDCRWQTGAGHAYHFRDETVARNALSHRWNIDANEGHSISGMIRIEKVFTPSIQKPITQN